MNLLKTLAPYKYYAIGIGFVIYSLGLWHISSVYAESAQYKEALKIQTENINLRDSFDKRLTEKLQTLQPKITTISKEVQHEIETNTIYHECKSPDSIVRKYNELLKTQ